MPDDPVDKQVERVDEAGEQTTVKEFSDALHDITADLIVHQVGEGNIVRYVVPWNGYRPVQDTARQLEHVSEHFINRYCRQMGKNEELQQRHGRAQADRRQKDERYRSRRIRLMTDMLRKIHRIVANEL